MFIYIVRHAWAGEFGDPDWPDDRLRPLTREGRQRFAHVAKTLADRDVRPRIIATSPLVRCRQTAEILSRYLKGQPPVVDVTALSPGSDVETLLRWTADQNGGDVAWVGHAPDVSWLLASLVGGDGNHYRFAKGTCAAARFDGEVQAGAGTLHWLVTANMLGC